MNDKDNSLEAIFYRLMSRQVPKQFHARVMGLFRKAAARHETEGDGRIRKAEPTNPLGKLVDPRQHVHTLGMCAMQHQAAMIMARGLGDALHEARAKAGLVPYDDVVFTMSSVQENVRGPMTVAEIHEAAHRPSLLDGLARRAPTKPRPVADMPKADSISPLLGGLKVIPVPHLPSDTIAVSQDMYDRLRATETET